MTWRSDNPYYTIEQSRNCPPEAPDVILLFSGGRDSSCAAARMYERGGDPILLSVIDSQSQSDDQIVKRVDELEKAFSVPVCWVSARADEFYAEMLKIEYANQPSCLNCCFVRLALAVVLAVRLDVKAVAAGFTSYQGEWVEQTPTAIQEIQRFLEEYGLRLDLPVLDLRSKEVARKTLTSYSLTPDSLEPDCHCAIPGTCQGGSPDSIRSDIRLFAGPARKFVSACFGRSPRT